MSRVRGRSFKITKNQARGYGYARPAYRRNPGVTTIAAINGRGSYAGSRSARSVMSKLKRNARPAAARRALTAAQKSAFKRRMAMAKNRSTSSAQSASSKKNIRKAQAARKAWGRKLPRGRRVRVGRATYGRKPKARRLKAGVYVANRRKKAGTTTMARRRRKSAKGATKKRRRSSKRRRKTTTKSAAPKRRRRRKSRKAVAGKRRSRRRGSARRKRRSRKMVANRRRSRRRKHRANPRRRRRSKAAAPRRRRRSRRKGSARRKRRSKAAAPRRMRRSRKLKANRRRRRSRKGSARRRSHRRNTGHKANRRRRHRRNGRRLFRRNGAADFLKMGAVLFAGFGLHRLLTNLVDRQVLSRLLPAPVVTPAATSGFGLQENRGLIASIAVGAGSAFLANKMIKNAETKKLIIGGIAVSTVQGIIMSLLKAFVPQGADMLAGPDDGTAARLSAMYGLGAGASIMPRYAPINGMGEYFREPMNGMGEYFREPMNGVGEYIAATAGLGTYEQNNDLFQAAAGMGNHDYNGNHIDPSGDLDRQLTIAEAAAGVGALSPFEAAAGIGPMEAAAGMRGFGAVDTVPSGDTWIPGSVNPQLWAGVRAIDQGQSATEMVPAGVLQTDGGQGIFG